ncbi:MAG: hypothetical protein LAO03_06980 [Acidobacteriia bacterium]|nr:hypothetical protein [Terriglobia bacterium]
MKTHVYIALLSVQLLMCGGAWQPAMAQPSNALAVEPPVALTSEQVVTKWSRETLSAPRR